MKTSSGTSVLPFSGPAPSSNIVSNAPQSDSSASFHEVLHQQGGDSTSSTVTTDSKSANSNTTTDTTSTAPAASVTTPSTNKSATSSATPPTSATTSTKTPKTTMSVVSDISAMLVQAAASATTAQKAAPTLTTPTTTTSKDPGTASDKNQAQLPNETDLATLIAQAMMVAANSTPATSTTPTTSTKADDSGKGAAVENAATTASTDLSTLIAQASILASNAKDQTTTGAATDLAAKSGATAGKDLPIVGTVKVATTGSAKEKKSASTSGEGTFLHSSTDASSPASSLMGLMGMAQGQAGQFNEGQPLASDQNAKKSPLEALAAMAPGTAGTANVEKKTAMNADPNIPQALSGLGANTSTIAPANTSDMQIKLSSNNEFDNALKQVMHVAQLTQTNESRTPMRVAIEIQTPPGAVVNVYVSKQNDQYRAQLSTNDPVALNWVQDKVTSLRQSNDLGVQVRWLPPQMEAASTSSGSDANLGWDRGGQGQSNYQQDERQQNPQQPQQTDDELPDFASIGTNFMKKLTTAGSAA